MTTVNGAANDAALRIKEESAIIQSAVEEASRAVQQGQSTVEAVERALSATQRGRCGRRAHRSRCA
jgi:hypothetical protein